MKKILIILVTITIITSSCQKEISNPDLNSGITGGTTGNSSGLLLSKIVSKTGSDSTITSYQYDAAKRLIRQTITGSIQGVDASNDVIIVRNASGIIAQTIQKSPSLSQTGVDSIVRTIHYDAASKRYTSAIQPISYSSFTFIDSTVFIYGTDGKVSEEDIYVNALGSNYLSSKWLFTYSGNNVVLSKILAASDPFSPLSPIATISATYDNKSSPIILPGAEAFAIGQEQLVNANNALTFEEIDASSSSSSFSYTGNYTYNTSNLPVTSITVKTPGSITTNSTYYYQ